MSAQDFVNEMTFGQRWRSWPAVSNFVSQILSELFSHIYNLANKLKFATKNWVLSEVFVNGRSLQLFPKCITCHLPLGQKGYYFFISIEKPQLPSPFSVTLLCHFSFMSQNIHYIIPITHHCHANILPSTGQEK